MSVNNETPRLSFLRGLTHCIRVLSLIIAITSLSVSLWFFIGFASTDTYALHLFSALLLCFGIGALFFLPACKLTHIAHKALSGSLRRSEPWIALLLILPWLPLSWYLYPLSGFWLYGAIFAAAYALLIIVWAVLVGRTRA
ncbi:MAG: hypothetical protein ACSHXY_04110 [Alphaproteobacteria bacterium]